MHSTCGRYPLHPYYVVSRNIEYEAIDWHDVRVPSRDILLGIEEDCEVVDGPFMRPRSSLFTSSTTR